MSEFCDVASPYQDGLPLSALAGDGLVVIKATEGLSYVTPNLAGRVAEARAAGLKVGLYHFARPGDPASQARFFLARTIALNPDWPILDLEVAVATPTTTQQWADTWARTVATPGWLYSGTSFARANHLSPPPGWLGWLAEYGVPTPSIPPGWATLAAWQYTDAAVIHGVRADRSHLYIDPGDPMATLTDVQLQQLLSNSALAATHAANCEAALQRIEAAGIERLTPAVIAQAVTAALPPGSAVDPNVVAADIVKAIAGKLAQ